MREGSLDAPTRHPLDWRSESFYDRGALDKELERVFDICHGCRRCFNLCDSFPKLFELIDESQTGELDSVASGAFTPVIDACTLCDMCFMTKCPYVPPHEFNLDFPHLMLRAKAVQFKNKERSFIDRALAETDRNGKLASLAAPIVNYATQADNTLTRPLIESMTGIDRRAELPPFTSTTFQDKAQIISAKPNPDAPAFGRKAVLYATCYVNFNTPDVGESALLTLAHNGVALHVMHPGCCGMPKLENGDLVGVAAQAKKVATFFEPLIGEGYDIIALTPSCALMLKFEWPLILPENAQIKKLAEATYDLSEYVVEIAKTQGLASGLKPLEGPVALHVACHARAQNMGVKAAEMLRLIPEAQVSIVERCSGHGGKWGMFKGNFETALKVGLPAGRQLNKDSPAHIVSECPLAGPHLKQVIETIADSKPPEHVGHPIELLAKAYGFEK